MKDNSSESAELVFDSKAVLGEGPVWDFINHRLFWLDIEGGILHCHIPLTNENKHWNFDEMIGAIAITIDGELLMALESGLAIFSLESKQLKRLHILENTNPKMRFNDGKCDPNGNFWIGTMHKEFLPGSGSLYKIDQHFQSSQQIERTSISNGMAWTSDGSKFYYIDSPSFEVVVFDFDKISSKISNRKTRFKIPPSYGSPDGMTIDNEGMLWIAHWGGGCVRRWNPENGKVLQVISVDAPHVTSCCFGGKDFNMLYITTARSGLGEEELKTSPLSGGLFCVTTKVAGKAVHLFKGKL